MTTTRPPAQSKNLEASRNDHTDRNAILIARNRIKAAIRAYFETQGFVEVDTPCAQISPGNEIHLHGFETTLVGPDLKQHNVYFRTSPEYACKKILAAGEEKIFTFAPSFRNREKGPLHHHEFTMLEWYRTTPSYHEVIADCESILRIAFEITGRTHVNWKNRKCDPRLDVERITVIEAFKRYAGIELGDTFDKHATNRDALSKLAQAKGITCTQDDTWSDIFSRILTSHVEPKLGSGHPTILYDYPMSEAAWAARSRRDPKFADRFEFYFCGIELANGARELTDPSELQRRMTGAMDERQRIYGTTYPIDEELLAALLNMPETSGVALGFDRLVMLATGAPRIQDVMWAPLTFSDEDKSS